MTHITPTQHPSTNPPHIKYYPFDIRTPTQHPSTNPHTITHKEHYIEETSQLIHEQYNYPVIKASKQVQVVYDEVVKQLVKSRTRHMGNNRYYKFAFDNNKEVFNNLKFQANKKRLKTWKVIQEINPLLQVVELGSKFTGISSVVISKELDAIVKHLSKDIPFVVEASGFNLAGASKIKINTKSLIQLMHTGTKTQRFKATEIMRVNNEYGFIPMHKVKSLAGRLFYKGIAQELNLQMLSSDVRRACFGGCIEIDIDACAPNYMIQQANKYNIKVTIIKQMLSNSFKKAIREDVAEYMCSNTSAESTKKAKQLINAITMGASLSNHKGSKLRRLLTYKELESAKEHKFIRDYYAEVQCIHEAMLNDNQHLVKHEQLRVVRKKVITDKLSQSKVCAYLYHRFESTAMQTALSGFEDKVRLLIHDGVYIDPITTTEINKIKLRFSKLGLTVSVKQL